MVILLIMIVAQFEPIHGGGVCAGSKPCKAQMITLYRGVDYNRMLRKPILC